MATYSFGASRGLLSGHGVSPAPNMRDLALQFLPRCPLLPGWGRDRAVDGTHSQRKPLCVSLSPARPHSVGWLLHAEL